MEGVVEVQNLRLGGDEEDGDDMDEEGDGVGIFS